MAVQKKTKNKIKKLSFKIEKSKSNNDYKVNFYFLSNKGHSTDPQSKHCVNFNELSVSYSSTNPRSQALPVHDIYSFNGTIDNQSAQQDIQSFWRQYNFAHDVNALKKIQQHAISGENKAQILFVLDIQCQNNKEKGYYNSELIKKAEKGFIDYLKHQSPDKPSDFVQCLREMDIQYVELEGGLKADLIASGIFNEEETKFLQEQGCKYFCQLVEFMLNAFKRGEKVTISFDSQTEKQSKTFLPEHYLVKANDAIPDFQPTATCVTYYPPNYNEMAKNGRYTKAMQQSGFFQCKTKETQNRVVIMNTTQRNAEETKDDIENMAVVKGGLHAC